MNKSTGTHSVRTKQENHKQEPSQTKRTKTRNRLLMLEQLSESIRNDSSTSECSMPNIKQTRSDEKIVDPYRQSLRERTKSTLNPSNSANLSNSSPIGKQITSSYITQEGGSHPNLKQKQYKLNHRYFSRNKNTRSERKAHSRNYITPRLGNIHIEPKSRNHGTSFAR